MESMEASTNFLARKMEVDLGPWKWMEVDCVEAVKSRWKPVNAMEIDGSIPGSSWKSVEVDMEARGSRWSRWK